MSPLVMVLAGTGAVAIFVAVVSLLTPASAPGVLGRIDGVYDPPTPSGPFEVPPERVAPADALRAGFQSLVGHKLEKSHRGNKLADSLARADLKLRAAEWLLVSAVISVLVGLLVMARLATPLGFPPGAAVGYMAAQFFVKVRQGRRRKRFDHQLAPAILSVSSGIKAGYTFAQALDLVSRNAGVPMATELARVTRETQLGVPLIDALAKMVSRNDSEDLRLMLIAVQIQSQVGGNLAQILDSIEATIRERVRIKGEIKTLTGQARASGWVLMILPFALAGLLSMIAPSYFTPMFHELLGQVMLGIAGFALLCGYGIIHKIVNVKI